MTDPPFKSQFIVRKNLILRGTYNRLLGFQASGAKLFTLKQNDFVPPPVRNIPQHIISLNLNVSAPMSWIYLLLVKTIRRVHDQSHPKLSAAQLFFDVISEKFQFSDFFAEQRQYFLDLSLLQAWKS